MSISYYIYISDKEWRQREKRAGSRQKVKNGTHENGGIRRAIKYKTGNVHKKIRLRDNRSRLLEAPVNTETLTAKHDKQVVN